jgi:hypothetical protein
MEPIDPETPDTLTVEVTELTIEGERRLLLFEFVEPVAEPEG